MIKYKVTTKDRKSYPAPAYKFTYTKDKVIKSKGPFGIFIFNQKKDAKKYIKISPNPNLKILRVKPIGKGKKTVCCPYISYQDRLIEITKDFIKNIPDQSKLNYQKDIDLIGYRDKQYNMYVWWCAPGTMTYPAVEVLN